MGNQLSNESGIKGPTRTFGRTGALGLTKAELDRRCTPSGLYPSCHWDEKAIRRLIGDGRLAARCKGSEGRKTVADQECPICFLHYSQLNETQCCKANICTECFLQVRPQREKHSVCPFCNNPKMFVSIAKRLDAGEIQEREAKEQRMIEATIRARGNQGEGPALASTEGFGSSLEQNDIVRRARSRTMSEEGMTHNTASEIHLLRQLSLSSDDRVALEREMRAQHTHPLALQMDAEAEERRIANEREYYRNNPQRCRESTMMRARGSTSSINLGNGSMRNRLTRINSVGSRGGRRFNDDSLDDMIVLEAALLLSMEEDGRGADMSPDVTEDSRSRRGLHPIRTSSMSALPNSSSRFGDRSLSEDEQVAMAIALSMQEQQEKGSSGNSSSSDNSETATTESVTTTTVQEEDNHTPPESAPPKAASAPSSTGVASLPKVSEDNYDDDDDNDDDDKMAEEILMHHRQRFKVSDDDSDYFRMVEGEENSKLSPPPRLKEG